MKLYILFSIILSYSFSSVNAAVVTEETVKSDGKVRPIERQSHDRATPKLFSKAGVPESHEEEFHKVSSSSKNKGMELFDEHNYEAAIPFLLEVALIRGALHKGALAECYLEVKNYLESAKWYIQAALHEASLNIAGDNTNLIRGYSEEAFLKLTEEGPIEAESILAAALREKS
jgi:hypothetical protein